MALTARESGYYVLYVDGEVVSGHAAEREAIERGQPYADAGRSVHYVHEYVVDITAADDAPETPDDADDSGGEPDDGPIIEPGEDHDYPDARVEANIGGEMFAITVPAGQRAQDGRLTAFNDPIVGVPLENMLADNRETLAGRYRVMLGDRVICDDDIEIHAKCRTRPQRDWEPTPLSEPNRSLFLDYGDQAAGADWTGIYDDGDNGPMGIGYLNPAMETTGERPEIGPRMGQDAAAMCGADDNLLAVVRGMADAAGPWPYHHLDPQTLDYIDTRDHPRATTLWAADGSDNPIAIGSDSPLSLSQAAAHAPAFGVGGYAFYGSEFDRQNMIGWALYTARLWQNPAYCARDGRSVSGPDRNGWMHGQVRGIAWSLRCLVDAHIVAPDNALVQMMLDDLADSMVYLFENKRPGPVWYLTSGGYYNKEGMAPYQWDFLTWAMAHAVNHGQNKYRRLLEKMAPLTLQRVNHRLPELAPVYSVVYERDGERLYSWDAMLNATAERSGDMREALKCEPGSQALQDIFGNGRPGDFLGNPGSGSGYAAIFGMALAGCAQVGVEGAADAYGKWLKRSRCNFSWNPQYGVRA